MLPLLQGVRIIEVGAEVLGPYARQILADLGAEVIKVEAIEGDNVKFRAFRCRDGHRGAGERKTSDAQ